MIAKSIDGEVRIGGTTLNYVSFGTGQKNLVILPGLSDGLATVKGTGKALAKRFKAYSNAYKVYVFSRKNHIEPGFLTRDMARDQAEVMKQLGLEKADVMGVSQGGMISQFLAIDYPEMVDRLVLVVTAARHNEAIRSSVKPWIQMAGADDYRSIMLDSVYKSYSQDFIARHKLILPLLGRTGKPKDFSRFLIQAEACMQHDAKEELKNISCPTLVIGGDADQIVGPTAAEEIAHEIKDSKLFVYPGLGHGLHDEAKDFNDRVLTFLNS